MSEQSIRETVSHLPKGLVRHVQRVKEISVELAKVHGVDVQRAELAAESHDIARAYNSADILRMARSFGLGVTKLDEAVPMFLHGQVAAELLKRDHDIHDQEVLDAVRYHTTGRGQMTALDKVLFLADKLDPGKGKRYPFIPEVMNVARKDIDDALLALIDRHLAMFIEHGQVVHPQMVELRNFLLLDRKG